MCRYCSQWNDEEGRCYASFWCPDKDRMEEKRVNEAKEEFPGGSEEEI